MSALPLHAPKASPADAFPLPRPAYSLADFARMLEFGDSMLPIGAFASSGALESAVQKGVVHDADTLRRFTATALEQAAKGDAVGLAWAVRAARLRDWSRLEDVDAAIHCRKLSEEARLMSTRMGKKMLEMCVEIMGTEGLLPWLERIRAHQTPGMFPVSLGLAFAHMGLSLDQALVTHQYGIAVTVLNAALRLMRVTHLDTQRILFGLTADFDRQCATASSMELGQMSSYVPMTDILGSVHVKAHVRLFMS